LPVDLLPTKVDDTHVNTNSEQDIKYRFGKAIRRRRRELDLSQEELAERSELHRTYISSIERGQRNPSLENIEKIAQALRISISDLFAKYSIEEEKETDE
jgi:transcriptional regulator with XRE-family HTH domain